MRRPATLAAVACLMPPAALLAPAAAQAQWSGSVGIDSQALLRGQALSDGHPSPRAAIGYDASNGGYAGLSAARTVFTAGQSSAQWSAYAGYAARLVTQRTLGWEAGLIATHYTRDPDYDYAEAYLGLLGDGWNLRLHGAPDYFGQGASAQYAEGNASGTLEAGWHWLAHAGLTHMPAGAPVAGGRSWRADWRLGLGRDWRALALQLAWVGAQPLHAQAAYGDARDGAYRAPPAAASPRPITGVWQLSASLAF